MTFSQSRVWFSTQGKNRLLRALLIFVYQTARTRPLPKRGRGQKKRPICPRLQSTTPTLICHEEETLPSKRQKKAGARQELPLQSPIQQLEDSYGNKQEKGQPAAEPCGVRKDQAHLFVPRCGIAERKNDNKRQRKNEHRKRGKGLGRWLEVELRSTDARIFK